MFDLFDLFRIFYLIYFVFCRGVRVAGSNRSEMLEMVAIYTFLYYFGLNKDADQLTPRCITRHPLFETICLQREGLETAVMGLCHVHGMRAPRVQS